MSETAAVTTVTTGPEAARAKPPSIPSPCIGVCKIDDAHGLCIGCARSADEVAEWRSGTEAWRQSVWQAIPGRLADLGVSVQRLPLNSAQILDFIEDSVREARGTWILGVYGGVGEFNRDPEEAFELTRDGDTVTSVTDRAALRLTVGTAGRLLAIQSEPDAAPSAYCLAVHRSKLALPVANALTDLGPDRDAIRPKDRATRLFDFGLNRVTARFCVRTDAPEMLAALENAAGLGLREMLSAAGADILKHSPTRVIESAMGRVEVETAIPAPGGKSPTGPHTHLLPGHLAQNIEAGPGLAIPEAYAVGALFYPRSAAVPD